jgi:23S rRNA (pseudouridine1915-N3)-methyltransferase
MQKITFVVVGKIKESFYREGVAEYVKRLSRFAKIEIKELAEGVSIESEAADILHSCKGYVIALAVEGEKLSSEGLAKKMQKLTNILVFLLRF